MDWRYWSRKYALGFELVPCSDWRRRSYWRLRVVIGSREYEWRFFVKHPR